MVIIYSHLSLIWFFNWNFRAIAVDHQIFALTKLDVTGNGTDDIVVCTWDGHTYILDQDKNSVRFQLDESVQAFESGYYTLKSGEKPCTCFAYYTFRNKVKKVIFQFYLFINSLISNLDTLVLWYTAARNGKQKIRIGCEPTKKFGTKWR